MPGASKSELIFQYSSESLEATAWQERKRTISIQSGFQFYKSGVYFTLRLRFEGSVHREMVKRMELDCNEISSVTL